MDGGVSDTQRLRDGVLVLQAQTLSLALFFADQKHHGLAHLLLVRIKWYFLLPMKPWPSRGRGTGHHHGESLLVDGLSGVRPSK